MPSTHTRTDAHNVSEHERATNTGGARAARAARVRACCGNIRGTLEQEAQHPLHTRNLLTKRFHEVLHGDR